MNKQSENSPLTAMNRVMEIVWLVLAIGFAIWVIVEIWRGNFEQIKIFILVPIVAFAMFYFRRWFRKKYERTMQNERDRN